jgi:hypothetical protein
VFAAFKSKIESQLIPDLKILAKEYKITENDNIPNKDFCGILIK